MGTILFDVAKGIAQKVSLTTLVLMDPKLRSYLAALIVAALHEVGDSTHILKKNISELIEIEFKSFVANREAHI